MTSDEPYDYWDALDRMDMTFDDFQDMGGLIAALDEALNRAGDQPYRPASARQIDMAWERLSYQRQQAIDMGFTVDRFARGGRSVTMMRDRFGRFVSEGAAAITRRLAQGGG